MLKNYYIGASAYVFGGDFSFKRKCDVVFDYDKHLGYAYIANYDPVPTLDIIDNSESYYVTLGDNDFHVISACVYPPEGGWLVLLFNMGISDWYDLTGYPVTKHFRFDRGSFR